MEVSVYLNTLADSILGKQPHCTHSIEGWMGPKASLKRAPDPVQCFTEEKLLQCKKTDNTFEIQIS
jgi:hypothetical protein